MGQRARDHRWQIFQGCFPDVAAMRVLDLGGTPESWLHAPTRPLQVHLVNTEAPMGALPAWVSADMGDACALEDRLLGGQFDLVYSNSVIEHVGGHSRRLQFASMVEHAAPRHWIQTPYRYFPIEPHWVAPLLQYLPLWFRAQMSRYWPLAHSPARSFDAAVSAQLGTELIDITQMRHYFPSSAIHYERIAGVVKSIIAIRGAAGARDNVHDSTRAGE